MISSVLCAPKRISHHLMLILVSLHVSSAALTKLDTLVQRDAQSSSMMVLPQGPVLAERCKNQLFLLGPRRGPALRQGEQH